MLLPASPEGMRESCSPSGKARGGPTSQAPMTTPVTSESKDEPDLSRKVPGYTTHQLPTEATPTVDCNLSPKVYNYHRGEGVQPGGPHVPYSTNMRPPPRSDEWQAIYHPWSTTTIEESEHYQETTRGMTATKWLRPVKKAED